MFLPETPQPQHSYDGLPLIIDSFAGGGGASTGIEAALGRPISIAINHDPQAIALHKANHPDTVHYCQSVWAAEPRAVVADPVTGRPRPVQLAWFSPDCKHFSKAKGGAPVEKNIRDLAWIVVQWAQRVRPAVIMLENVEEFKTWAPLGPDNRPVSAAKRAEPVTTLSLALGPQLVTESVRKAAKKAGKLNGETFDAWVGELRKAGYKVEWRELRACDYGAPTSRKRLFVIARCDGMPIVWPEPTHGKPGSPEVLSGQRLPWRTAAEIIDWSIPCPSIFERQKPLADATCRRIAAGLMRFVINAAKPFIVPLTHHGGAARVYDADQPIPTITAAHRGEMALVSPTIVGCGGRRGQSGPVDPVGPFPTQTAKADACLVTAALAPYFARTAHGDVDSKGKRRGKGHHGIEEPYPTVLQSQDSALVTATLFGAGGPTYGGKPRPVDEPIGTIPVENHRAIATATLISTANSKSTGRGAYTWHAENPLRTITASGGGFALVETRLAPFVTYAQQGGRSRTADAPFHTITASPKDQNCIVTASLVQSGYGEREGQAPRTLDLKAPLGTVVAGGAKHALVAAWLHKYRAGNPGATADGPMPTITANSFIKRPGGAVPLAINVAHLAQFSETRPGRALNPGHSLEVPVSTIVQKGPLQALVASTLVKFQRNQDGKPLDEPLDTVMAGGQHHAQVSAFLTKYYGNEDGAHAVDAPIGTVTTKERFGLTQVTIDGQQYVIADIGMRMLTPRELFNAQGFPPDYIIDPEFNGKPLTKTSQIAKCGNSVCPPLAEALVRANLPELCVARVAAEAA